MHERVKVLTFLSQEKVGIRYYNQWFSFLKIFWISAKMATAWNECQKRFRLTTATTGRW